jgi:hypothetical protein
VQYAIVDMIAFHIRQTVFQVITEQLVQIHSWFITTNECMPFVMFMRFGHPFAIKVFCQLPFLIPRLSPDIQWSSKSRFCSIFTFGWVLSSSTHLFPADYDLAGLFPELKSVEVPCYFHYIIPVTLSWLFFSK